MRKRAAAALVLLFLAFVPAASADSGYIGSRHLTLWVIRVIGLLERVWGFEDYPGPPIGRVLKSYPGPTNPS
jgi:hypothetical protein